MERITESSEDNYLNVLAQRIISGEIDFVEARRLADNYHAWHEPSDPEAA